MLRDQNTTAEGCVTMSDLCLGDANFNVTTLVNTGGDAVERYVYSPYGVLTIYDATWANIRSASSYANAYTYTGRQLDTETDYSTPGPLSCTPSWEGSRAGIRSTIEATQLSRVCRRKPSYSWDDRLTETQTRVFSPAHFRPSRMPWDSPATIAASAFSFTTGRLSQCKWACLSLSNQKSSCVKRQGLRSSEECETWGWAQADNIISDRNDPNI